MRRFIALFALVPAGCYRTEVIEQAPAPLTADERFRRGAWHAALDGYSQQLDAAVDRDEADRARYLHAMVLLTSAESESRERAAGALADLAQQRPPTLWSRLATVVSAELATGTALHRSVLRAGVELHRAETQAKELRIALDACLQLSNETEQALSAAKEDRARLAAQIKQLSEAAAQQTSRITELETELEELKRIDMRRSP